MIQGHAKLMHDPLSKSVCCCQLAKKGTEQGAKNRAEELRTEILIEEKRLSWERRRYILIVIGR